MRAPGFHRSFQRRVRLARRLCVPLCLLLLSPLISAQTSTTERDRAAAAAKRTEDRLRALHREADALAAQERTVLVELRKLEVERQISVEQLNRVERDRAEVQGKLDVAESRAAALAQAAATQLPDVEARLEYLYKMGRAGYWRLLLNVDDLQALGRAYRTASTLTEIDRARVQEYYATLDALATERKALQARAEEIAGLQAEAFVLAVNNGKGEMVLLIPDQPVPDGTRVGG